MKTSQALLSAIHLFLLFLTLGLSFFLMSFLFAPQFCYLLSSTLLYNPQVFFSIGLGLFFIALLLIFCLYGVYKFQFLRVGMQPYPCQVEASIIEESLKRFWERNFSEREIHTEVIVTRKNTLEIVLYLSPLDVEEQQLFLEKAEKGIGDFLRNYLDYRKGFVLTLCYR